MRTIDTVFIIDDDPITVFGIKKILTNVVVCKTVSTYMNGKLAIDDIKENINNGNVPQIIFLDINMPIMDGWQFLEEFLKLPITQKVRINIVTSSIDQADRDRWEFYKSQSHHLITFNSKPIKKSDMGKIAKIA
ncbi:response regulator [Aggregatimonas sangjinii]|uniref:Response regulator n=1 Tax=Aggregatimonas sangjinii TaxID=2583587 RepID=A0A5B7SQC8_9FLAO|nr:response regulator [Aggregatimonas sangjinii]QCW99192.1 response regulator [Aggregatimonas sangjinii]